MFGLRTAKERMSGFVNYFLQPGVQGWDTFLKDEKKTLRVIEEVNSQVQNGDLDLDGVALVSFYVESMYNNMTEQLGIGACKEFLENRNFQEGGVINSVSTESILSALDLCLKSNN